MRRVPILLEEAWSKRHSPLTDNINIIIIITIIQISPLIISLVLIMLVL